jgi:hypothetical protein
MKKQCSKRSGSGCVEPTDSSPNNAWTEQTGQAFLFLYTELEKSGIADYGDWIVPVEFNFRFSTNCQQTKTWRGRY